MNFLQICQEANRLAGMQGTVSSVTVSSGYQEILINFCKQAFTDLQEYRTDWPWMRSSATFNTVQGTTEYSLQTIVGLGNDVDIQRWVKNMILYVDSNDNKQRMNKYSYDSYNLRNVTENAQSVPSIYAQDPIDKHLYINPPDDVYEIEAHYYTRPVTLTASADIPLLPISYHLLISYQGAAHMCGFMGNANLTRVNQAKADVMLGNLLRGELPGKRVFAGGIA